MAASKARPTTLELTESETRLRDVLLGVATYIDEATAEDGTAVQAPAELAKEKVVLRWTGGWVRDKLLGVGSHDIDVAINKMTGENFGLKMLEYLKIPGNDKKHGLEEQESKKIVSGLHTIKANPEASKNLETATIKIMGIDLDLVNLRKETYNEVSRNPQMEFGTAEEDAMRRDATVNAMFYNLNTKQIEDFTGRGFSDMDAKIIRTPLEPYQTFKDDPLRVLRLIRFASRLNYTIEPDTASAMANPDIQEALKIKIKRERVGIELEKMLKGPDPHMALELINRFDLYRTIFTDPTRDLGSEPETSTFAPAYNLVKSFVEATAENTATISRLLLRNTDEKYLAWISAALMPWADAPQPPSSKPSKKRPLHASVLAAQEGFKAPNVVCNVIASSVDHMEEIKKLADRCYKGLRKSTGSVPNEATARDTLGMAIRRWGATWRTQVLFSLIHEVVSGSVSQDLALSQYAAFLVHLESLDILNADTLKPLVKGTDLAKAMDLKPGPWMKDALEEVLAWQLRNPTITDPAQVIEEVKKNRKGELLSRLISRSLTLTIRPLFLQTERNAPTADPVSRKLLPWQTPENAYAQDLLRWVLKAGTESDIKTNFSLLTVPILSMLDAPSPTHKAQACTLATLLIRTAPPALLASRGYTKLLSKDLLALFTYLPTLTPEPDSATLFASAFPGLLALAQTQADSKLLDSLMRDAVLAPLFHISTPGTYPRLSTVIFANTVTLLDAMGVDSVPHMSALLPPLLTVLNDPFAPAAPGLLGAAAQGVQALVRNGWPRVDVERVVEISMAVCRAWMACGEYEGVEGVRGDLKGVMRLVRGRVEGMGDERVREVWAEEVRKIVGEKGVFAELFGEGEGV